MKKKEGQQRLIVDARIANYLMRLPPKMRLGSAAAMAELRLSDEDLLGGTEIEADSFAQDVLGGIGEVAEINIRASAADVDDSFYQLRTPQLASWFAVPQLVDPREIGATQIWSEQFGRFRPVQPGEKCYVGFSCLYMGWPWALHFCHTVVSHIARYPEYIELRCSTVARISILCFCNISGLDGVCTPLVFYTYFHNHAHRLRLEVPTDFLNHFRIQMAVSILKIKPLALANGHGRYMAVAPERTMRPPKN